MLERHTLAELKRALAEQKFSQERTSALNAVIQEGSYNLAAKKLRKHPETIRKHCLSTLSRRYIREVHPTA